MTELGTLIDHNYGKKLLCSFINKILNQRNSLTNENAFWAALSETSSALHKQG